MSTATDTATLSTHVLDTMHGCPAAGISVQLSDATGAVIWTGTTNADGRCTAMPSLAPGQYVLQFETAAYFRAQAAALSDPPFLDLIPLHFGVAGGGHYHVPLLVSPYAYSTYRGS